MNLASPPKDLLHPKLYIVQQLMSLKCTTEEKKSFFSFSLTPNDHWLPGELAVTKILRNASAVEPIGLHSLSWRFGDHPGRAEQARVVLRDQALVTVHNPQVHPHKASNFLNALVFANIVHKMIDLLRYEYRVRQSLMVEKVTELFLPHRSPADRS